MYQIGVYFCDTAPALNRRLFFQVASLQRFNYQCLMGTFSALGCVIKRGRMKKNTDVVDQTEPIGIIISSGHRDEQPPVFSAYIWGPAPEPTSDPASKAA